MCNIDLKKRKRKRKNGILGFSYLPTRGSKTRVHTYAKTRSQQTSLQLVALMK